MHGKKTGRKLAKFYRIDVRDAHYYKNGDWYQPLREFPGAYFDDNGCIIFDTERSFMDSAYLSVGINVHVRGPRGEGISFIPGYL
jgi:hypothetical protein